MNKTIFVVDDQDVNLSMAKDVLKVRYKVMTMSSAARMLSLLDKIIPDLILLDINMPGIDGFDALEQLKSNEKYRDIPVIFLTSMTDPEVEAAGFQLGVIDFVAKPFSAPVLLNRIKTHLDVDAIIQDRTTQLKQKTIQLQKLQNAIIFGFADIVESRDKSTGGHIDRTSKYMKILTDAVVERGVYPEIMRTLDLNLFISSARLHDVGKIVISDTILNKPGKLSIPEIEIMKTHATAGEQILDQIASRTDDDEFLRSAKLFAGYHHERWDGQGYPNGLAGTAIPLHGRIMAIVDVYDALVSDRPYKKAYSHEDAVKIITANSGTQFDAALVDVFYEVNEQFKQISQ